MSDKKKDDDSSSKKKDDDKNEIQSQSNPTMDGMKGALAVFTAGANWGVGGDMIEATRIGGKLVIDGINTEREARRDELRIVERLAAATQSFRSGDGGTPSDGSALPSDHWAHDVPKPELRVHTPTETRQAVTIVVLLLIVVILSMIMIMRRPDESKVEFVFTPKTTTSTTERMQREHPPAHPSAACSKVQRLCRQAEALDLPSKSEVCAKVSKVCVAE